MRMQGPEQAGRAVRVARGRLATAGSCGEQGQRRFDGLDALAKLDCLLQILFLLPALPWSGEGWACGGKRGGRRTTSTLPRCCCFLAFLIFRITPQEHHRSTQIATPREHPGAPWSARSTIDPSRPASGSLETIRLHHFCISISSGFPLLA